MIHDLALIEAAAREVGAEARRLKAKGLKVWSKAGGSPVTNADIAVDGLLKAMLGEARPDYGWLSEETADDPARLAKRRLFVVDPIDGTAAFFKEKPWWSVSIAVVEDAGRSPGWSMPRTWTKPSSPWSAAGPFSMITDCP